MPSAQVAPEMRRNEICERRSATAISYDVAKTLCACVTGCRRAAAFYVGAEMSVNVYKWHVTIWRPFRDITDPEMRTKVNRPNYTDGHACLNLSCAIINVLKYFFWF